MQQMQQQAVTSVDGGGAAGAAVVPLRLGGCDLSGLRLVNVGCMELCSADVGGAIVDHEFQETLQAVPGLQGLGSVVWV
jgi:hypothetical protein